MQLLGELLLERSNLKVMVKYVADEENLKLMMNLLKDQSRSIQFEAFHVFKVCTLQLDAHCATTSWDATWGSSEIVQQRQCLFCAAA